MRRFAWLIPCLLAACGDNPAAPDAAPIDATDVDAPDLDAPTDAPIDAPLSRCAATAERVLDLTPRRVSSVTVLGDRVYFEARSLDLGGAPIGGEVLSLDPVTLDTTVIRAYAGSGLVTAAHGWLYGLNSDATGSEIWRYQPGQPIAVLVTGRENPYPVVSDGTNLYWVEGPQIARQVVRRAIAGGAIEPMLDVQSFWTMTVDDTHLYIADGTSTRRMPSGGGPWQGYVGTAPYIGLAVDGQFLYRTDLGLVVDRVELATGTPMTLASHGDILDGHEGLALSATHIYLTSSVQGIERVPRTGGDYELVWSGPAAREPVFLGDVLYWTDTEQLYRCTTI